MKDDAVLVYMTSLSGTGWEGNGERDDRKSLLGRTRVS
jgi:hypothetical protein